MIRGGIAGRNWQNLGTGLDNLIWDALGGGGSKGGSSVGSGLAALGRMF